MNKFTKHDTGKPDYSLCPPEELEDIIKVMTFGAAKYSRDNWKNCDDLNRYTSAALRHIEAYRKGELIDPESGLPHLAHAGCNLIFLSYLSKTIVASKQHLDALNTLLHNKDMLKIDKEGYFTLRVNDIKNWMDSIYNI